ncbi:nuclear transport factor 2 family protein [Pseudochelatococcus sp. B33]
MARADEVHSTSEAVNIALSYFTLLMKRDLDAFERIWHEDGVNIIPFPPEGFGKFVTPAFEGREEIMEHYRTAFKNRSDHVFWIDAIHETEASGVVIIEAHARSLVGETKRIYENEYVCVFHIDDGKIRTMKEYANPLQFMRAFEGGFDAHR